MKISIEHISSVKAWQLWYKRIKELFEVHYELRKSFQTVEQYDHLMRAVINDGAFMLVAEANGEIVGLVVARVVHNTLYGKYLYIDDLIVVERYRRRQIGQQLMSIIDAIAKSAFCEVVIIDGSIDNHLEHKFYFNQNFRINGYHFMKKIEGNHE